MLRVEKVSRRIVNTIRNSIIYKRHKIQYLTNTLQIINSIRKSIIIKGHTIQ